MKTPTGEHLKPRSQYVEDAIRLAMDSKWEEAVELNQFVLENFGPEDQVYNRLGKALTELGRLEEARDQYEKSLRLNPFNTVAKKNRSKLEVLIQHKADIKSGATRVDLNLFVEEMGKTVITQLEAVEDPDVCEKVVAGDIAELTVAGDTITVATLRGIHLGQLEPKLARRLIKFMQGGNRYQAGVTGCENGQIRVIVRETYQDPKFAGKPSFPMRQKREVAFRPYARESLLQRDAEFPTDEDEEDLVQAGIDADIDEDEGMHEVEEDSEPIDFAEEADSGDDEDREDS
ncbi:MAG: tetratricopeptide repeat protein [Chloroflexi bacterium]|nr:MAG: tetratricopeptide repeat protein [Chloroflexota bacterium]